MPDGALAVRCFATADQERFAFLSGDRNPMHMDRLAARRTAAGECAVHGVHALLWSLEMLAPVVAPRGLRAIDADFAQFLRVGETASLFVVRRDDAECRAELRVDGERVAQYVLKLGEMAAVPASPVEEPGGAAHDAVRIVYAADRTDPLPLTDADMRTAHGEVAHGEEDAGSDFPALARWIGSARLGSLLALTRLVGMVSPGLHSTFHRLAVTLTRACDTGGVLRFATRPADRRFAIVTIVVASDGIVGTLKASRRQPPAVQPGMSALASHVAPGSLAGRAALVVGGSRGLGEVTAKLLALGGASVAITYAAGRDDAERVVAEIAAHGGDAHAFRYDCLEPAAAQLEALRVSPGSVYYFATTQIFGRTAPGFSRPRFALFTRVYVDGFHDLVTALAARAGDGRLRAFYPSSVAVTDTPRNMAEYAMAKAAGEILCRDLDRFSGRIAVDVERLPRLPTDQTASMIEQDVASPAAVMAAIVRRLEQLPATVAA